MKYLYKSLLTKMFQNSNDSVGAVENLSADESTGANQAWRLARRNAAAGASEGPPAPVSGRCSLTF